MRFAIVLLLACGCGSAQYPLPRAVGQTHHPWPAPTPVMEEKNEIECVLPQDVPGGAAPIPADVLGDAEVFGILFSAHDRKIVEARIVLEKTADPGLRRFAEGVLHDHVDALDRGIRIAQSLDVTSWDTKTSKRIRNDAKLKTKRLASLGGVVLDEQYLENAIEEDLQVLALLDAIVLRASTRDLRAHLEHERAMSSRHLGEARALQHQLDGVIASR